MRKTLDSLSHASWLYPFKGIYYSVTHPFLYPFFRGRLVPAFLLCLFVVANLFIWTYVPQWLVMRLYQGPVAFWNATILVLGEATAITAMIFEAFFIDETQVDIFDAVLINEGYTGLVAQGRNILPDGQENEREGDVRGAITQEGSERQNKSDPVRRLGRPIAPAVYAPFSLRQIVEFIVFLPLNFIPAVGPVIYLLLIGRRGGPLHHWRYFHLRGLDKAQRRSFERDRKLKYTFFGTAAMLLQLVPVLSMAFLCTTAVGSALWAVRLEELRIVGNTERGQPDEQQPETYSDDPV